MSRCKSSLSDPEVTGKSSVPLLTHLFSCLLSLLFCRKFHLFNGSQIVFNHSRVLQHSKFLNLSSVFVSAFTRTTDELVTPDNCYHLKLEFLSDHNLLSPPSCSPHHSVQPLSTLLFLGLQRWSAWGNQHLSQRQRILILYILLRPALTEGMASVNFLRH